MNHIKDPVQRQIHSLANVITEALNDAIYAKKVASDDDYPTWLQQLTEKLGEQEVGNYSMIHVIKGCLEEPRTAARWAKAARNGRTPDWFRAFAETFSKRKKFPIQK